MVDLKDKILGVIYGTAIGDALGWWVEFDKTVTPSNPKVFSHSVPREYTDDTQMFRAVCEGILKCDEGVDQAAKEVAKEFIKWARSPENNRAPGGSCMSGCRNLERGVYWRTAGVDSGGCGTAMRSMAYGIRFHNDIELAAEWAAQHALMTHRNPMAQAAAAAVAVGVAMLVIKDRPRPAYDNFLTGVMLGVVARYDTKTAELLHQAATSPQADPYDILDKWRGWAGHEAVAASLWCFLQHPCDYEKAVLLAVNSPGDSDSLGAITGALVGAGVGLSGIPKRWVEQVEDTEGLRDLGERIYARLEKRDARPEDPSS